MFLYVTFFELPRGFGEDCRNAKVCQLDPSTGSAQEVLWLHVPMDNAHFFKSAQCLEELAHYREEVSSRDRGFLWLRFFCWEGGERLHHNRLNAISRPIRDELYNVWYTMGHLFCGGLLKVALGGESFVSSWEGIGR